MYVHVHTCIKFCEKTVGKLSSLFQDFYIILAHCINCKLYIHVHVHVLYNVYLLYVDQYCAMFSCSKVIVNHFILVCREPALHMTRPPAAFSRSVCE